MSKLSELGEKVGLPEIDFAKHKGNIVQALIEELVEGQVEEVLKKLPDDQLALLLRVVKEEAKRRIED